MLNIRHLSVGAAAVVVEREAALEVAAPPEWARILEGHLITSEEGGRDEIELVGRLIKLGG